MISKIIQNYSFLGFLFVNFISNAQIIKQQFFNIPAIGNNGGQHALGWYWDKEHSGIQFYVSGHQNGQLWSVGKNQYKNFKEGHEAKKGGGKLLDNILVANAYESHIFLNVWELKLDKDLQTKGEKQYTFRRSGITSDTVLHFAKFGNIVSLDSRGSDGKIERREETTNLNLTEFNKLFSNVPDIGDTLGVYRDVNQKGEGSIGLKNISPWLTSTAAIYKYDSSKGFLTEKIKDFIVNFKDIEALKNATYVDDSFNYIDKNFMHAWFIYDAQEKKDRRKYKLVTFNAAGKVIASSDHVNETSKRPIVLNFPVYTNKLEAAGLVSVFGHDGDAPKELEGKDVTVFDIVYTDIKGNVLWKATFTHGDEKKYKNVVTPLRVFAEGDKLIFLNYKMESLFKISYEMFSIDNKGNKQILIDPTTKEGFTGSESAFDYLQSVDITEQDGNAIWLIKFKEEKKEVGKSPITGMSQYAKVYKQLFISMLGSDYKVGLKKQFLLKETEQKPNITLLSKENNTLKYLIWSEGDYYLLTLNKEKGADLQLIKSDLLKGATPDIYFSFMPLQKVLNDADNKTAYLIHEFYSVVNLEKRLNKILVTKLAY